MSNVKPHVCLTCTWWTKVDPSLCLTYQEGTCCNVESERFSDITGSWEWCKKFQWSDKGSDK